MTKGMYSVTTTMKIIYCVFILLTNVRRYVRTYVHIYSTYVRIYVEFLFNKLTYVLTCATYVYYICRLEKDFQGKDLELTETKKRCEFLHTTMAQKNEELTDLKRRYNYVQCMMYISVCVYV